MESRNQKRDWLDRFFDMNVRSRSVLLCVYVWPRWLCDMVANHSYIVKRSLRRLLYALRQGASECLGLCGTHCGPFLEQGAVKARGNEYLGLCGTHHGPSMVKEPVQWT